MILNKSCYAKLNTVYYTAYVYFDSGVITKNYDYCDYCEELRRIVAIVAIVAIVIIVAIVPIVSVGHE